MPRQATTGGKPRLLGISRRGSTYLRKQLIHGARRAVQAGRERHATRAVLRRGRGFEPALSAAA